MTADNLARYRADPNIAVLAEPQGGLGLFRGPQGRAAGRGLRQTLRLRRPGRRRWQLRAAGRSGRRPQAHRGRAASRRARRQGHAVGSPRLRGRRPAPLVPRDGRRLRRPRRAVRPVREPSGPQPRSGEPPGGHRVGAARDPDRGAPREHACIGPREAVDGAGPRCRRERRLVLQQVCGSGGRRRTRSAAAAADEQPARAGRVPEPAPQASAPVVVAAAGEDGFSFYRKVTGLFGAAAPAEPAAPQAAPPASGAPQAAPAEPSPAPAPPRRKAQAPARTAAKPKPERAVAIVPKPDAVPPAPPSERRADASKSGVQGGRPVLRPGSGPDGAN